MLSRGNMVGLSKTRAMGCLYLVARFAAWSFVAIALLAICVGVFFMIYRHNGHSVKDPVAPVSAAIASDIIDVANRAGITWQTQDAYLASEFGVPLKQLLQRTRIRDWRVADASMRFTRTDDEYRARLRIRAIRNSSSLVGDAERFTRLTRQQATMNLLTAITAGPNYWVRLISDFQSRHRVQSTMHRITNRVTPAEPRQQSELVFYWNWLSRMTGTSGGPMDGWGSNVGVFLDRSPAARQLIAASAGPDRKWCTADDIVVSRNIRTGALASSSVLPADAVGVLR